MNDLTIYAGAEHAFGIREADKSTAGTWPLASANGWTTEGSWGGSSGLLRPKHDPTPAPYEGERQEEDYEQSVSAREV